MPGSAPVVVKVGGRLIADEAALNGILEDVARVSRSRKIVFVHGGGDIVTEYSRRCGVEPRFVVSPSGVRSRYTSREELEVYVMVMAGKVNKEIVSRMAKLGVNAVGVSGADCSLLKARRKERIVVLNERGRPQVIPGGYTGRITGVNTSCLWRLLETVDVLVVAPIALGEKGELLNVDADQAAAQLAAAVKADPLVFLTDVPGLIVDGQLIARVRLGELESYAAKAGYGMNRKLLMAGRAVEAGARLAVIADGRAREPLTRALEGVGTIVTR